MAAHQRRAGSARSASPVPPCAQSTWRRDGGAGPGMAQITVSAPLLMSTAGPISVIDRALAVLDVDAGVVDDQHRAGGALQHDAAGGRRRRRVGDGSACSARSSAHDVWPGGIGGGVARASAGTSATHSPEAADPDRDSRDCPARTRPRRRSRWRHDEHARSGCRRPARRASPSSTGSSLSDVGHLRPCSRPLLLGIDVVRAPSRGTCRSTGSARRVRCPGLVGGFGSIHGNTLGTMETRPFRVSEKLCLYSPRLILCVTLFT